MKRKRDRSESGQLRNKITDGFDFCQKKGTGIMSSCLRWST